MIRNLLAEMARHDVTEENLATTIKKSRNAIKKKLKEDSPFMHWETIVIRDAYFPGLDLEYLFAGDTTQPTQEEG